jgi:phage gp46-like protein
MSKYTKPIPLDELPETPAVYGEMIEEYNETKRTVSRDIEVEGLGKGRLVLSKQNKGKPFFYADEANIEANQKAAKQLQTAETIANAPLLLAPFFSIVKGGQRIIKQRRDNQIKKSVLAAEDLDKVKNVIDLVKSRTTGTPSISVNQIDTTAPTKSIMNLYGGKLTPQQKEVLSGITARMAGGLDVPSIPPKGVKLRDDPIDRDAALFRAQSNADNLDVDQVSPTFGQELSNFGVPMPTQLANELRGQATEEIVKGSVANVNPSQKIALNKSITEIPGYKTVVGSPYYYDYNVIRQLIAGGTVAKELGLRTRGVSARDFLEAFQTPVTIGGASRGVDFGTYRNMNVPKLREAFGPALDALGLPRNAAQIHHIAALHGISGIFHKLGYNSPIYREVVDAILAELPEFAKGIGSMSGNLMPIISGSADSPHYYAHLFYVDVIGKDGSKFFTPEVLENMVKSRNYRIQKAKELGQIIAQAERIASQAQTIYEQLYAQGTGIPFSEIMDVMMQLNIEGKLPRNIMAPRYQVKAVGNLIKDINLALEIERLNPSLDVMNILQTKNRRNVQILRDVIAGGGTGEDAQKALNKLYGKPLKGGAKQIDFFEDLIDVENFLDKYRVEAKNKREAARERRNQAKYFEDPDIVR